MVIIVLERCKTPVFGLKFVVWGLVGGRNFLKEVRTLLGVHKERKPGFSLLCRQLYKFKLFAKDKETFRLTVREMQWNISGLRS